MSGSPSLWARSGFVGRIGYTVTVVVLANVWLALGSALFIVVSKAGLALGLSWQELAIFFGLYACLDVIAGFLLWLLPKPEDAP